MVDVRCRFVSGPGRLGAAQGPSTGSPGAYPAGGGGYQVAFTEGKLIQKTYPVGDLVSVLGKDSSAGAEALTRTIVKAINPKSWSVRGGSGTLKYVEKSKSLVVRQSVAVQKQVATLLNALAMTAMQAAPPASATGVVDCLELSGAPASHANPRPLSAQRTPSGDAKQYGHFVMDNLRVNAMGVSCTVKRLRFQYRGDGLDNDVAKCALGKDPEQKTLELPKALMDLLEELKKSEGAKGGPVSGGSPGCSVAPCPPVTAYSNCPSAPCGMMAPAGYGYPVMMPGAPMMTGMPCSSEAKPEKKTETGKDGTSGCSAPSCGKTKKTEKAAKPKADKVEQEKLKGEGKRPATSNPPSCTCNVP